MNSYILEVLFPFFHEIHMPLFDMRNTEGQRNDIPDELSIIDSDTKMKEFVEKEMCDGGFIIEKMKKKYIQPNIKLIYKKNG